jgi:predicted dehydrogenase
MKKNNTKCAIIGLGRMGIRHLLALKKLNLKLVGVADKAKKARENIKKKFHLNNNIIFKNIDQLLLNTKPQLLIISTTADSHARLVEIATKYKIKKILVEKPMATSIKDCKKMILVCKKSGSSLNVNHNYYLQKEYIRIKKIVNSKKFGGVKSFNYIGGNIGIAMNGVHLFDRFNFITNNGITKISSWFSEKNIKNPRGKQFKDKAGQIKAENNKKQRFYIDVSSDQGHGGILIIACKYGIFSIDLGDGKANLLFRKSKFRKFPTTRYALPQYKKQFKMKITSVEEASASIIKKIILNKKTNTTKFGLEAVKILTAAYKSNKLNGKKILINSVEENYKFPWA